MRRTIILFLLAFVMSAAVCFAEETYPSQLDDGKLILVDAQMGVGIYADRSSVHVKGCKPPKYMLSIDVILVKFSEEYYRSHGTYIGGPYKIGERHNNVFRYNSDQKTVSYRENMTNIWKKWDINRFHSHAEGYPLIPLTAETAFTTAFQEKFYGDTRGYDNSKVIDTEFYNILGF